MKEENEYNFQVEYPDPAICPNCAVYGEVVRFGKKEMKLRDLVRVAAQYGWSVSCSA